MVPEKPQLQGDTGAFENGVNARLEKKTTRSQEGKETNLLRSREK